MKCHELMKSDPACCLAGDAVTKAADILWLEDIGPVPVVADMESRRLLGIVGGRELAVRVIVAGRDPRRTRIEEVMEKRIWSCLLEDDVEKALVSMTEHQLRCIPVVDDGGALHGVLTLSAAAGGVMQRTAGAA